MLERNTHKASDMYQTRNNTILLLLFNNHSHVDSACPDVPHVLPMKAGLIFFFPVFLECQPRGYLTLLCCFPSFPRWYGVPLPIELLPDDYEIREFRISVQPLPCPGSTLAFRTHSISDLLLLHFMQLKPQWRYFLYSGLHFNRIWSFSRHSGHFHAMWSLKLYSEGAKWYHYFLKWENDHWQEKVTYSRVLHKLVTNQA